jgi:hypothetical protein
VLIASKSADGRIEPLSEGAPVLFAEAPADPPVDERQPAPTSESRPARGLPRSRSWLGVLQGAAMPAVAGVLMGLAIATPLSAARAAERNVPIIYQHLDQVQEAPFGPALAQAGRSSIQTLRNRHQRSIEQSGVGLFYGDHSSFHAMSPEDRATWLHDNARGPVPKGLRESSCIGWALENLSRAYAAVGRSNRWAEIEADVVKRGSIGTVLAEDLAKDGWEAVYFNPDVNHPKDGDPEHPATARIVRDRGTYYGITVRRSVINYAPSDGSRTVKDLSGEQMLERVPFFFGLARGGRHTFVGHDGIVSEFHWMAEPNDADAIQETPLPDFDWLSGVIMIPPSTWPGSPQVPVGITSRNVLRRRIELVTESDDDDDGAARN